MIDQTAYAAACDERSYGEPTCEHSDEQNMGGECEVCYVKRTASPVAKLIAKGGSIECDDIGFWQAGDDVYRAPVDAKLDTYRLPMGRRWECSIAHWQRFRSVFAWTVDV